MSDLLPARELPVRPTDDMYRLLQNAYSVMNKALFDGELPNCLITLQRKNRSYGYFSAERFQREDGVQTDEIALNPAHFRERLGREVLGTLAHEMVHLWQHHFGESGRGRYHNRQWAEKMKAIGLQPTATGEEGGAETGEKVHHLIIAGGDFERLATRVLSGSAGMPWVEIPRTAPLAAEADENGRKKQRKSGKRITYVCAVCALKAWAKHEARLVCGEHLVPMQPL